jgi:hypothetical protein
VSAFGKLTDPELDQEAQIAVQTLQIGAEGRMPEGRRSDWMDGSDCDDGDQRSEAYLGNEIEGKLRPVSSVFFI